jgi:hypothetical protein
MNCTLEHKIELISKYLTVSSDVDYRYYCIWRSSTSLGGKFTACILSDRTMCPFNSVP